MRTVCSILRVLMVGVLGIATSVWATPQTLKVNGSLFNSTGLPFTGSKDLRVRVYTAASAGTLLWTSAVYNTTITAGRFTINMDASSGSPSLTAQISANSNIYFQIDVDSGATNGVMDTVTIVMPRIRASGAAFALSAAKADTLLGVSASATELNALMGVTNNLASLANNPPASGSTSYWFSTIFASLDRFYTSASVQSVTIDTGGAVAIGGSATGYAILRYKSYIAGSFPPFAVGSEYLFGFHAQDSTTANVGTAYAGVGSLPTDATGHDWTKPHVGIKMVWDATGYKSYASVANGTTESTTLITGDGAASTKFIRIKRTAAGSIEFYKNGSLVATMTTNLPAVTDVSDDGQTIFQASTCRVSGTQRVTIYLDSFAYSGRMY